MKVSMVVTMEISDDLDSQELKQELRLLRQDIELCLGADGFPIIEVEVSPALKNSEALKQAKHHYIYL
jgi:hypothetical protein